MRVLLFFLLAIPIFGISQDMEVNSGIYPVKIDEGSFKFRVRNSGTSTFGVDSVATVQIGHGGGNVVAGFVFDAMNGDFLGLDYGSLYQLVNGDLELRNRSANDVTIITSNSNEVKVTSQGDVYLKNSNQGLILTSPNGSCRKLVVDDDGFLKTVGVTCPN